MKDKMFYVSSNIEKASHNKDKFNIAGYANTTAKDRAGDIVTSQAWAKGVENFRRNPVLLYQHKHDCPIGKVNKITVDKKGIFVDAAVSNAAETQHGIQTLIKDGALKSFSVGFKVKDGKYSPEDDSMYITDVELLEISIVSVPCNQNSLFSIRKSFETDEDYTDFVKSFKSEEEILEVEINSEEALIETDLDKDKDEEIEEIEVISDPSEPIPFLNLLSSETAEIKNGDYVKYQGKRYKIVKIATAQSPTFKLLEVDVEGKDCDNNLDINAEEIFIINTWDLGSKFDLILTDIDSNENIKEDFAKYVNATETQLYRFKESQKLTSTEQEKLNTLLNIKTTPSTEWNDLEQKIANHYINKIKALLELTNSEAHEDSNISLALKLHGYFKKENDKMAEQVVDTLDLTNAGSEIAEAKIETAEEVVEEKTASATQVSEPEVAKLVEKTGEAIMKESDAKDKQDYTPRESEELEELKSQISKYKDEVKALTQTKMVYQENARNTSQFSEKDMANAYLLAHCMNKRDVFDTRMGAKMKAITTVDQFLSNFSSNIYTEMEQQLVIAPMFNRIAVDARNFRVPVADEDTDGDVAQFASGTFATGIADHTNVPVTNQNTISAVTFTPHKFMATTHLAKDEEEDTVLPLLDFLRAAATRRLARAIDKSLLRGTGALTGFNAAPTNAITAGTGYGAVFSGVCKLASDVSLTVSTGSASDKADPSDIASARSTIGKYGLQLGDQLVYLTTIEGYNNLVTTSDFRTVDKFGPNATYLTGSVGAVYGIPIQITEFLDAVGSTSNQIGCLIYKPGFMIAERRGMEIESEYEPRQQVTAMYLSTRFDMKALTTNSSAALDTSKYSYACNILAG